jgi:hypothetical protein
MPLLAIAMLAFLTIRGFVIVQDTNGHFASATIVDGSDRRQPMHKLPPGLFVAIPDFEGGIEFRCDNGPRIGRVYVTTSLITSEALDSRDACYEGRDRICSKPKPVGGIDLTVWEQEMQGNDCLEEHRRNQTSSTSRP